MINCKKCGKPLHPLSRYASIGIGPECLKSTNPDLNGFLKEMNIRVEKEDSEHANDLLKAFKIESDNRQWIHKVLNEIPEAKESAIDKASGKFSMNNFRNDTDTKANIEIDSEREEGKSFRVVRALVLESVDGNEHRSLVLMRRFFGLYPTRVREDGIEAANKAANDKMELKKKGSGE